MAKLNVDIVTPERRLISTHADEVVAPAAEGLYGVRPGHSPFLSTLSPGPLTVRDGSEHPGLVRGRRLRRGAERHGAGAGRPRGAGRLHRSGERDDGAPRGRAAPGSARARAIRRPRRRPRACSASGHGWLLHAPAGADAGAPGGSDELRRPAQTVVSPKPLELFHRLDEPRSARVRRWVVDHGLLEVVRFRNVVYPEAAVGLRGTRWRRDPRALGRRAAVHRCGADASPGSRRCWTSVAPEPELRELARPGPIREAGRLMRRAQRLEHPRGSGRATGVGGLCHAADDLAAGRRLWPASARAMRIARADPIFVRGAPRGAVGAGRAEVRRGTRRAAAGRGSAAEHVDGGAGPACDDRDEAPGPGRGGARPDRAEGRSSGRRATPASCSAPRCSSPRRVWRSP